LLNIVLGICNVTTSSRLHVVVRCADVMGDSSVEEVGSEEEEGDEEADEEEWPDLPLGAHVLEEVWYCW
jgi:hypothetical protein